MINQESPSDVNKDWGKGPPSPLYLFILGMDVLSRMLKLAYEGWFIVRPWNPGISCLKYVNDTIMLLPPDMVSIKRVKILICIFELLLHFLSTSINHQYTNLVAHAWICLKSLACFTVDRDPFLSPIVGFPLSRPLNLKLKAAVSW